MVAISTTLPIHRLDAEHYGQVIASGALDDQRVELIDGVLVDMSPHSPQHSGIIQRLTEHLSGSAAGLRVQLPLQVAADSIPEPDLALVEQPQRMDRHPTSAVLVAEIADALFHDV